MKICTAGGRCAAHPEKAECRNLYVATLSRSDLGAAWDRTLWEVVGGLVASTFNKANVDDLDRWFWRLYDPRGDAYGEPLFAATLRHLAAEIVGSILYRTYEAPDRSLSVVDRLRVYEVSFYSWLANPRDPLARRLYALALVVVGADEETAKAIEGFDHFPTDERDLLKSLLRDRSGTLEKIRAGEFSGELTCISCMRLDAESGFWEAQEEQRSLWFSSQPRSASILEGLQRTDAEVLLTLNSNR